MENELSDKMRIVNPISKERFLINGGIGISVQFTIDGKESERYIISVSAIKRAIDEYLGRKKFISPPKK